MGMCVISFLINRFLFLFFDFQRAALLESLQAVQATPEEMQMFSSISEVHARRFKT